MILNIISNLQKEIHLLFFNFILFSALMTRTLGAVYTFTIWTRREGDSPRKVMKTYPLRSRCTVSCRSRPCSTGIRPSSTYTGSNVSRVRRAGEWVARQRGCRSAGVLCDRLVGYWISCGRCRPTAAAAGRQRNAAAVNESQLLYV